MEPLMGQVHSIIELIRRSMGDQNIKSPVLKQLEPQLSDPILHLPLRILIIPRPVTHGASKPKNPHPLVNIDLVINADTSVRRNLPVFLIVVPMYIQNGHRCKCRQE